MKTLKHELSKGNDDIASDLLAIFLPSLRGGGAEQVMVALANGFAEKGYRVDLVLAKAEGPYMGDVSPLIRVVDLTRGRVAASLPSLIRYLRRERPSAMLSALNHANIIAIWARTLARVKTRLVVSEHSPPSMSLRGGGKTAFIRFLMRRFYPLADAVICVSKAMRQEMINLLHLPPEKLYAIYNPLNLDRIHRMMNEPIAHDWLTNRQAPVILAVGRLTEPKDYPTMLAAFALLRERRPARLIILGEGVLEAELRQRSMALGVAEDIHFAGFQANPFAWMRAANLYVLSSRWEGLSNTLIEALACGTKVVSTNCPVGPAEVLEGGKWGRLVAVGDVNALAEALAQALDDRDVQFTGQSTERFDSTIIIERYKKIIYGK